MLLYKQNVCCIQTCLICLPLNKLNIYTLPIFFGIYSILKMNILSLYMRLPVNIITTYECLLIEFHYGMISLSLISKQKKRVKYKK